MTNQYNGKYIFEYHVVYNNVLNQIFNNLSATLRCIQVWTLPNI